MIEPPWMDGVCAKKANQEKIASIWRAHTAFLRRVQSIELTKLVEIASRAGFGISSLPPSSLIKCFPHSGIGRHKPRLARICTIEHRYLRPGRWANDGLRTLPSYYEKMKNPSNRNRKVFRFGVLCWGSGKWPRKGKLKKAIFEPAACSLDTISENVQLK